VVIALEFGNEFGMELDVEFGVEFGMELGAVVLSIGLVVCANAGVARTAASAAMVKVCLIMGFLLWRFAESAAHEHAPPVMPTPRARTRSGNRGILKRETSGTRV
jgi:hypothetical protein